MNKLGLKQKQHGITNPGPVHISTIPLKKGGSLNPKDQKAEAMSGSSLPATLRRKAKQGVAK